MQTDSILEAEPGGGYWKNTMKRGGAGEGRMAEREERAISEIR